MIVIAPKAPTKADKVVEFLDAHPEFFKAVKSMYYKVLASRDPDSSHHKYLIRQYTRIIKIIADTNIDFTKGTLPDSTNNRLALIDRLQNSLSAKKPLHFIWLVEQGSAFTGMTDSVSAITVPSSGKENHNADDVSDDEEDWCSDDDDEDSDWFSDAVQQPFFSRLAASTASHLVYQDLVPGPPVTLWSYRIL